jgi:serine/threonine-protein kinase RsbW
VTAPKTSWHAICYPTDQEAVGEQEVTVATAIAGSDRRPAAAHCPATALGHRAVSLDLRSCAWTIEAVDAFVGEVAASAGFDADSTQDVQIAVREAVTNAIVHGNGRDESRRVRLEVAVSPAGLEIRVQDQGRGFGPSDVPDPLAPQNLCRSCGRGILFMRSLMDQVRFDRAADGGTQVLLLKRRAHAADATRPAPGAPDARRRSRTTVRTLRRSGSRPERRAAAAHFQMTGSRSTWCDATGERGACA